MEISFVNTLEEELLCGDLDNAGKKKPIAPNIFFALIWTLLSYLMYLGFGIKASIIFFILGIIYIVLIKKYISNFIRKIVIKKQKTYLQNKHIKLSDKDLLINIGSYKFCEPLNRIEKYIIYDDKIYIRLLDTCSLIIPKRAFTDTNLFNDLIKFIKEQSKSNISTFANIDNIQKESLQKSFDILINESYKPLNFTKCLFIILSTIFSFMISIAVVGELHLSSISALIVPLVFIGMSILLSPKIYNKVMPPISQSLKLDIFYEIQKNLILKDDGIHYERFGETFFASWNDVKTYRILVNNVFLRINTDKLIPVYFKNNDEKEQIINLLDINNIEEGEKRDFNLIKLLKLNQKEIQ